MLLEHIKNENLVHVICISDYIFNKTESFPGVLFRKGKTYLADTTHIDHGLISVLKVYKDHPENDVQVGMSMETFDSHFHFYMPKEETK